MLSHEMQMKQLSNDFQAARLHEARMHRLSKTSNNQDNLVRRLSQALFNQLKSLRPDHSVAVGKQQPLTS